MRRAQGILGTVTHPEWLELREYVGAQPERGLEKLTRSWSSCVLGADGKGLGSESSGEPGKIHNGLNQFFSQLPAPEVHRTQRWSWAIERWVGSLDITNDTIKPGAWTVAFYSWLGSWCRQWPFSHLFPFCVPSLSFSRTGIKMLPPTCQPATLGELPRPKCYGQHKTTQNKFSLVRTRCLWKKGLEKSGMSNTCILFFSWQQEELANLCLRARADSRTPMTSQGLSWLLGLGLGVTTYHLLWAGSRGGQGWCTESSHASHQPAGSTDLTGLWEGQI